MSRCVCGHSRGEHRLAAMSVPLLPNPAPLYPMPEAGYLVRSIATTHARATYVRDECWCGCGEFLSMPEDW
jgi:hypothetical protein